MIGQTLGHYRIVSKIAAGGMGVVYRAHDERLDRDVALKVLPAGTIANEDSRKRFRHEALALAKLNHPNIETVHEFGSQENVDYLAMELIVGQPLSEKLKEGPLEEIEVLRLASQFVDGLAAAHEHNIVHRDIKPGNLMVMPDGRLKILDFGLAKLVEPALAGDLTQSVETDTGKVAGTIPYMSPEQLRGRPVDQRTDIFAAGAVLYEMVTGRRPFPQSHSAELMGAILHKNPDPPSSLNQDVSPGLESVIYKTLEKDPESRYHTARELKAALEGISATAHRLAPSALHKSPRNVSARQTSSERNRQLVWLLAVAIVVIAAVTALLAFDVGGMRAKLFGLAAQRSGAQGSRAAPIKPRKSIAVLQFKNVSGRKDKEWESTEIAEMFTSEFGAGDQLRTVSGEDIAQMKVGLELPDVDSYGRDTLEKIHKNLNTDFVVLGSYISLPDGETRIDVRLQDTADGSTLASISKKGKDLDALVTSAGTDLREKIGVASVSLEESAEATAAMPENDEARRLYSEGLAKLRTFEYMAARDLLQRASVADPNSAAIYSALAEAYTSLGYDEKARQAAHNASDLSKSLSREDRLVIEGRYHEANQEWDRAIDSYRTLFGYFPDNPEYGFRLASAQISGGHAKDALDTIEKLRDPTSPAHEDPRVDLTAADAALALGNFKGALEHASTAESKARANGSKLFVARALLLEAQALESLGQPTDATATVTESQTIYHTTGDRRGEQATLEIEADILADHDDTSGAVQKYKDQLAIARDIGNRHAEASAMNNMALELSQQGDSDGAKKMWQEALVGFHDVSDKADSAEVLLNLAGASLDEGDLVGAKATYVQALEIFRDVNDSNGISSTTTAIGNVLFAQGDCTGAKAMIEKAINMDLASGRKEPAADKLIDLGDVLQLEGNLAAAKEKYDTSLSSAGVNGDMSDTAYASVGLGKVAMYGGELETARDFLNKALQIRTGLGEKKTVAQTQVALARLFMESGNVTGAISLALGARDQLQKMRDPDNALVGTSILIRALVANQDFDEARRERAAALGRAKATQNVAARLEFEIASALLDGLSGNNAGAKASLAQLISRTSKLGLIGYQLESELALAQLESKSPNTTESRIQLQKLLEIAKDKGYLLIARKAIAIQAA